MKCPKCGFVELTATKACRYCGSSLQPSILIPFPVTQPTPTTEVDERSQPDWRAELRQRIEAIRARREIAAAMQQEATHRPTVTSKPEEPPSNPTNPMVAAALKRIRHTAGAESKEPAKALPNQSLRDELRLSLGAKPLMSPTMIQSPTHPRAASGRTEHIVEGALVKERLAYDDTRSRDHAPTSIEPTLVSQSSPPAPDQNQLSQAAWLPDNAGVAAGVAEEDQVGLDDASFDDTPIEFDPLDDRGNSDDQVNSDYELGKASANPSPYEAAQSGEFQVQTATFAQRLRSGAIDGLVMVLANVPFVALVELNNGNFADWRIQLVLGCMAAILYLFYLTLMLVAAGQTIGMMAVGIIAVDARSFNLPSVRQALRRAIGPLLAALPGMLGFLFPILDSQRRSLSDMISGTTVKQAFEEISKVRAPWLYHHIRS